MEGGGEGEAPEHCKRMPLNMTGTAMWLPVEYHAAVKKDAYEGQNSSQHLLHTH